MPNTIPATGEAMPTSIHSIATTDLCAFEISELFGLYEALRLTENVLDGVMCQPRFNVSGERRFNKAGKALDALNMHIVQCIDLVVDAVKAIETDNKNEIVARAWMLLKYEGNYQEDLDEFLMLTCEQTVAASRAEAE